MLSSHLSIQKILRPRHISHHLTPRTTPIPKRTPFLLTMSSSTDSTSSAAISSSFHNAHSDTYERMASGCTRIVAEQFIPELSPPITASSYVLDNACGSGLVTRIIKAAHPDARIKCTDLAPAVLDVVKSHVARNNWTGVETEVLDVRDLKTIGDNTFTHVLTNFGFSPTPDDHDGPTKAAKEMYRVLKKGGVCVVTTWAERNFPTAMEATARAIRPSETPFTWDVPGDWTRGFFLMQQLEDAGFGNRVSVKSVDTRIEAGSLDELVENMLLFKDMFYKGYTEEEKARLHETLKGELRKLETFVEGEGSAAVGMVAWVGVGWKV